MTPDFPNRENGGGVISSIAKVSLVMVFCTLSLAAQGQSTAPLQTSSNSLNGVQLFENTTNNRTTAVFGDPGTNNTRTNDKGLCIINGGGNTVSANFSFINGLDNTSNSSYNLINGRRQVINSNFTFSTGEDNDVTNLISFAMMFGENLNLNGTDDHEYLIGSGLSATHPLTLDRGDAFGIGFNTTTPQFIARFNQNTGSSVNEQFQISVGEIEPPDAASIFARGGLITQSTNTSDPVPGTGIWNSLGRSPQIPNVLDVNGLRSQDEQQGLIVGVLGASGDATIAWSDRSGSPSQKLRLGPINPDNGTLLERITIEYNGNTGFGTTNPDRTLVVNGNTRINEGLSVGYNGAASGATGVLEVGQDNSVIEDFSVAIGENNEMFSGASLVSGSQNLVEENGRNLLVFGHDHTINSENFNCFYGGENVEAGSLNLNNFAFGHFIEINSQEENQYIFGTGDLTAGTALFSPNRNSFLVGYNAEAVLYADDRGFVAINSDTRQGLGKAGQSPVGGGSRNGDEELYVAGDVLADSYFTTSDKRWKKNIESISEPLDAIANLNGYQYEYRTEEFPEKSFDANPTYGLMAQELVEVYPHAVRANNDGYMVVNYNSLSALFVEAIKDQQDSLENAQQKIEQQQLALETVRDQVQQQAQQLNQQQTVIAQLQQRLNAIEQAQVSEDSQSQEADNNRGEKQVSFGQDVKNEARLYPAEPNPFNQQTRIRYFVPEEAGLAQLNIYSMQGQQLKAVSLEIGNGAVIVEGGQLQSGSYVYELVVDGVSVAREQMIRLDN